MQMMDHNPNKEHQRIYRNLKDKWAYEHIDESASKSDIVSLFVRAAKFALTQQNILAAWKQVGLLPWNPRRINTLPSLQFGLQMDSDSDMDSDSIDN